MLKNIRNTMIDKYIYKNLLLLSLILLLWLLLVMIK